METIKFRSKKGHFSYNSPRKRIVETPSGKIIVVGYDEVTYNHCVPIAHIGQFRVEGEDLIVDGPRVESDPPWAFKSVMENLTGVTWYQNHVHNLDMRDQKLKDLLKEICIPFANEWNEGGIPTGSSKHFEVRIEEKDLELFGKGCISARVYAAWNGCRYVIDASMGVAGGAKKDEIVNHPFRRQIRYIGFAK